MEPQESKKAADARSEAKDPNVVQKKMRPLGRFLEKWDWIWTLPLGIGLYFSFGWFFGSVMGMAVGNFDLSFVQPLFLAMTVVTGASVCAIYIIRFHWKSLYRFIYSTKTADDELSSVAAFKLLEPWQKISFAAFYYFFFVGAVVAVYLTIL